MSRCDHPTADKIYENIHKKFPNISKSTVYRNLEILNDEGKINKIVIPNSNRFDLRLDDHYHIHCKICDCVEDVTLDYKSIYDKKISKETGFSILGHNMVFEGICPNCQTKINVGGDEWKV